MRKIVFLSLPVVAVALALASGVAQAQDVGEVVSKVEFVVVGAECRLNFTITYHNETITGAVAWTEEAFADGAWR